MFGISRRPARPSRHRTQSKKPDTFGDSSLDVLEAQDRLLRDMFQQIRDDERPILVVDAVTRARSVERRYRYGQAVKAALRQLAVRQSAAVDVASAIAQIPALAATAENIQERASRCRTLINECRDTVRSRPLMSVNAEGGFVERFSALMELADATVAWELQAAIPRIRASLHETGEQARFHTERHVRRDAPTRLATKPRWYESAPVLSRLKTLYDHLMEARF